MEEGKKFFKGGFSYTYYAGPGSGHTFYAEDEKGRVGEMDLEEDGSGAFFWLSSINVDKPYQKKGIGSQLIALAVNMFDDEFQVPARAVRMESGDGDLFLTKAGAALVNSCIKKKILDERKHCQMKVPGIFNIDHIDQAKFDEEQSDEEESYPQEALKAPQSGSGALYAQPQKNPMESLPETNRPEKRRKLDDSDEPLLSPKP